MAQKYLLLRKLKGVDERAGTSSYHLTSAENVSLKTSQNAEDADIVFATQRDLPDALVNVPFDTMGEARAAAEKHGFKTITHQALRAHGRRPIV